MTLRYIGELATFSIVVAVAKASIEQPDTESLKILKIWKGLGSKLIQNSAYSFNIPHQLIFQHGSNSWSISRYTMKKSASKYVAVTGSGDKHAKTSTFIINLPGNFLPMQLIDWGKTDRSLLSIQLIDGGKTDRSLLPIQLIDKGKTDRSLLPIQLIDGLKQIEAYSQCNWLMG